MYCPECRSEYVDGVTKCPDCSVALADELSPAGIHLKMRQDQKAETGNRE